MSGEKVAREVAEKEFERFAKAWDIDVNVEGMANADRDSFNAQKDRIVSKIMSGAATVGDKGEISYDLQHPGEGVQTLVFQVPNGAAYMAMDRHKDRESMHKLYEFLGAMTKQPPKFFANMDARDVKFCQGVAVLFLAS